jgi:flagellar biosynthesis protein FlhB
VIVLFTVSFIGISVVRAYTIVATKSLKLNFFQINCIQDLTFLFSGSLLYQFLTPHHQ